MSVVAPTVSIKVLKEQGLCLSNSCISSDDAFSLLSVSGPHPGPLAYHGFCQQPVSLALAYNERKESMNGPLGPQVSQRSVPELNMMIYGERPLIPGRGMNIKALERGINVGSYPTLDATFTAATALRSARVAHAVPPLNPISTRAMLPVPQDTESLAPRLRSHRLKGPSVKRFPLTPGTALPVEARSAPDTDTPRAPIRSDRCIGLKGPGTRRRSAMVSLSLNTLARCSRLSGKRAIRVSGCSAR